MIINSRFLNKVICNAWNGYSIASWLFRQSRIAGFGLQADNPCIGDEILESWRNGMATNRNILKPY